MLIIYLWTLLLAFMILVTHLHPQLTVTELAFAAVPIGTVGGAWLFFLITVLLNFLSVEAVTISCVVLAVVTVLYIDPFVLSLRAALPTLKQTDGPIWYFLGPLAAVASVIGVPLYSSRYLVEDGAGNWWTGGSTWADLPIHLHIANSFLHGRNRVVYFDGMHSPVFAGEPMKYPFLPDFHAAALVKAGASMHTAMWAPGFACYLSLIALLFLLNRRVLTGLASTAIVGLSSMLSVVLVVCAGGMGGVRLALSGSLGLLINGTLDPIQDDVGAPGTVNWFGFLAHVLIPQRGATFAYPLVIAMVLICWVAVRGRVKLAVGQYTALLVTAGLCAASLPLVQAHSFIGVGVYMACLGALEVYKAFRLALPVLGKTAAQLTQTITQAESEAAYRALWIVLSWVLSGAIALIGAYPQLKLFSAQAVPSKGFMVQQLLWKDSNFFSFWWSSLAATVFVTLYAGYGLITKFVEAAKAGGKAVKGDTDDDPTAKGALPLADEFDALQAQVVVFVASFILFFIGNVVKLQPWDRDNVKLFYIWLFIASGFNAVTILNPFMSAFLNTAKAPAAKKSALGPAWLGITPLLLFLMVTSGALSLIRETNNYHILYGRDEVEVGQWLIDNTRTDSVVLTTDTHRSPAGYIAGRPSLVAFTGWMWSHGYDYHQRNEDRNRVFKSLTAKSDPEAATKLYRWGVKYVLNEASSPRREPIGELSLGGSIKRVFQVGKWHVYRVKYDGEDF